jgi:serine/threonine protein kinase
MIKQPENEIKVIDYDFAQKVITGQMSVFYGGTRAYLSPEQYAKTAYSLEKNQVWQLGAVLYKLYYLIDLSSHPHGYIDITTIAHWKMDEKLNTQRKHSAPIVKFLQMALSKDPTKRPTLAEVSNYFKNL